MMTDIMMILGTFVVVSREGCAMPRLRHPRMASPSDFVNSDATSVEITRGILEGVDSRDGPRLWIQLKGQRVNALHIK